MEALTGNAQHRHLANGGVEISISKVSFRASEDCPWGRNSLPLPYFQKPVLRGHWKSAHWEKLRYTKNSELCITKHPLHHLRAGQGLTKLSVLFKIHIRA